MRVSLSAPGRRPSLLWTDGSYEEDGAQRGVGFLLGTPDAEGEYSWTHGAGELPDELMSEFIERRQQIGQVEIAGAIIPYLTVPELLAGRDVVHFIDNTSAVVALSKGYSGAPDSARLVHMFHAWQAGSRSNVWFEYVPTDANPADEPSRVASLAQGRYVVGDIVSEAVDLRFPPLGSLDHLHGWCVEAAAVRARM